MHDRHAARKPPQSGPSAPSRTPDPSGPARGAGGWRRRDATGALLALGLGGGLAGSLSGCGGGEDRSKAHLRLLNASVGYDTLDLVVDGDRLRSAVAFGSVSGYADVDPSHTDTDITREGGSAALFSATPSLTRDNHYTYVATGDDGSLSAVLLSEETSEPGSGEARLRVLNGADAAGGLDVYLTPDATSLDDAAPLFADAELGTPSAFDTVDADTWRLRVTAADDRDDLRLDIQGVELGSRQIATLVLVSGAGGVLVDAMLLDQQGELVRYAGGQARVRAVAAVPGASISASVGGVALLSGVTAPAIGLYQLVDAGAAETVVQVGGVPVTVPAADLDAGTDHTLLVWGPASAPEVAWISDDNRPPAVSTHAALRLVHAVAGLDAALSMTVDLTPRAEAVQPGTASTRTTFTATADSDLAVTAEGLADPIYTDTEVVLSAGSVYTLFMLGSAASPAANLRPER